MSHAAAESVAEPAPPQRPRALQRLLRNRGALVGLSIVALALVLSVFAPLLAPHDPNEPFGALTVTPAGIPIGPSRMFPLGADPLGRCVLSRLLYGGRVSLAVAFASTAILAVVGTVVGVLSGYFRGKTDTVLMRGVDVLMSFPFLLVVMAVNKAVARPGIWVMFLILGLLSWTGVARQVRARTLQLRELDYVTAARALGATHERILFRHLLPNLASLVTVLASSVIGSMIMSESVLSYLGVGVVPPTASWGSMLQDGEALLRTAPRLTLVPGLAILVTVVGFNLLGEGLRDALDPKE